MVQNKKDETSTLNYDERNKILLQKKSNTIEHKTEEVKRAKKSQNPNLSQQ